MFFIKEKTVLEREPYSEFQKEWNKMLTKNHSNEIHMRITVGSAKDNKGTEDAFSLDYCYTKWFDLSFKFMMISNEDYVLNQRHCVVHTISYQFADEYRDIMMDTVCDIQAKSKYFYISSLVKDCEVQANISRRNVVTITFCVACDKENQKEVCLQLISHDVSLFARGY